MSMAPDSPKQAWDTRHLIGQMTCDVEVGRACRRFRDADQLAWTLRDELLPAVEGAIDQFYRAGRDVRVDEITIDLGEWSDGAGWSEIRQELRVRLIAALEAAWIEPEKAAAERYGRRGVGPGAQEFLVAFRDEAATGAMLRSVAALEPGALAQLRRDLVQDRVALRDAVRGLSVSSLRRLVGVFFSQGSGDAVIAAMDREALLEWLEAGDTDASDGAEQTGWAALVQRLRALPQSDRVAILGALEPSARIDLLAWLLAERAETGLVNTLADLVLSDMGLSDAARELPGLVLLAAWRRDIVAFARAMAERRGSALAALMQGVAGVDSQGDRDEVRRDVLSRTVLGLVDGGDGVGSVAQRLTDAEFEARIGVWRRDPGVLTGFLGRLTRDGLNDLFEVAVRVFGLEPVAVDVAASLPELRQRLAGIVLADQASGRNGEIPLVVSAGSGALADLVDVLRREPNELRQFVTEGSAGGLERVYREIAALLGVEADEAWLRAAQRAGVGEAEPWVVAFQRLFSATDVSPGSQGAVSATDARWDVQGLVARWRQRPDQVRGYLAGGEISDLYRAMAREQGLGSGLSGEGEPSGLDGWVLAFSRLVSGVGSSEREPASAMEEQLDAAALIAEWRRVPAGVRGFVSGRSSAELVDAFRVIARAVGVEPVGAPEGSGEARPDLWIEAFQRLVGVEGPSGRGVLRSDGSVVGPEFDRVIRWLEEWRRDPAALRRFLLVSTPETVFAARDAMAWVLGAAAADGESADDTAVGPDVWARRFEGLLDVWETSGPVDPVEFQDRLDVWRRDGSVLEAFLRNAEMRDLQAWVRALVGDGRLEGLPAFQSATSGEADVLAIWRRALRGLVGGSEADLVGQVEVWRENPRQFRRELEGRGPGAAEELFRRVLVRDGAEWGADWIKALAERAEGSADGEAVWRDGLIAAVEDGLEAEGWRRAVEFGGALRLRGLVAGWQRSPVGLAEFVSGLTLDEVRGLGVAVYSVLGSPAGVEAVGIVAARAAGAENPIQVWRAALEAVVSGVSTGGVGAEDDPLEGNGAEDLLDRWLGDPVRFEIFAGNRSADDLRRVWRAMMRRGVSFERLAGGEAFHRAMEAGGDPKRVWREFLTAAGSRVEVSSVDGGALGPEGSLRDVVAYWGRNRVGAERQMSEWRSADVSLLRERVRRADEFGEAGAEVSRDDLGQLRAFLEDLERRQARTSDQNRDSVLSESGGTEAWRVDLAALEVEMARRDATGLAEMLTIILRAETGVDAPPLLSASLVQAGQSGDQPGFMREVLRNVVAGEPVDLERILGLVAGAEGQVGDGDALKDAVVRLDWDGFVVALDAAPLRIDAGPAEISELLMEQSGRVRDLVGHADRGLQRAAALLVLLGQDGMTRLASALRVEDGVAVAAILWPALPDRYMQPGVRDATMWRFVLLLGDGYFPRSGGVAGIVATALSWLSREERVRQGMAEALLVRLEGDRSAGPAGLVAQVVTALKAMVGTIADTPNAVVAGDTLSRTAGLVLLAPYLAQLFQRLGLVGAGGFRDEAAVGLALDALNHVVNGDAEPGLAPRPLEKILCGLAPEIPLLPPRPVEPDVAELIAGLLGAVISQWKAVGNTSVEGLRETFLRRDGLIDVREDGPHLRVKPGPYDMLLDSLPWSFSVVKYSWMPLPLHVTWRNTDG